jgi:predicted N-acyltransferase
VGDAEFPRFAARTVDSFRDIDAAVWDHCAGADNPFVSHRFLLALEESGSATKETGWAPTPLILKDERGAVVAAAPLYLKNDSLGEYVFDHAWADALERKGGGPYYPKLQMAVPFTPVPGPRLLAQGEHAETARRALAAAALEVARRSGVSSLHVTFCSEAEALLLQDSGYLLRTDEQFHWLNDGYETFDDFLAALSSRKRKAIRKERLQAVDGGATRFRVVEGAEATEADWDAFFAFYMDTGRRKWGSPYLNRAFFRILGEQMADSVVLVMALQDETPVAGALNLKGEGCLFGRYWGSLRYQSCLHFELCYYQAIEYAIRHGLGRIQAGAQGPHKLARGYLPVRTFSAHWIADPAFRRSVAEYLGRERRQVDDEIARTTAFSPFRVKSGEPE